MQMTLDEFRATGRDVADLSTIEHIACSGIESGSGRTYLEDTLFIERDTLPYWSLTIGNWSASYSDLAAAEAKLYEFAVSEGYIDGPADRTPECMQEDHLTTRDEEE